MSNNFKITKAGDKTDSHDLLGLEIEQTAEGYQLVVPRRVLATANMVNLIPGKPLISFKIHQFHGWDWTLNIDEASEWKMSGTWTNNAPNTGPSQESDNWTASGSGGAGEPGQDEGKAAAAK